MKLKELIRLLKIFEEKDLNVVVESWIGYRTPSKVRYSVSSDCVVIQMENPYQTREQSEKKFREDLENDN